MTMDDPQTIAALGIVALTDLDSISIEAIRQRLKENQLKPWQKKNVVPWKSKQSLYSPHGTYP